MPAAVNAGDRSHPTAVLVLINQLFAVRVAASLTAGTVMLGFAFIIVMVWIVRPGIVRKDPDIPGILKNQED